MTVWRTRTVLPVAVALIAAAVAAPLMAPAPATAATGQGDELFGQQWGLAQIRAPEAWQHATGSGAVIAIVDSGVDLTHPDLQDPDPADPSLNRKILPGNTFLGCGPEGCGDGGWRSGPPWDSLGHRHGTHVAGIAAAVADNGIGIVGVAPDAQILPVRVLGDDNTGVLRDIAYGIRWAVDHGADVINLSLSSGPGGQAFGAAGVDEGLEAAVQYALDGGVVVVAAAGNATAPLCDAPAGQSGVICVTATDNQGLPASYANLPLKYSHTETVAAPGGSGNAACGENILSTVPLDVGPPACGGVQGFAEEAGTSMAAPHVAGLAALLVSMGCSAMDTRYAITARAGMPGPLEEDIPWTPLYGSGLVDAKRSVDTGLALPSCRENAQPLR